MTKALPPNEGESVAKYKAAFNKSMLFYFYIFSLSLKKISYMEKEVSVDNVRCKNVKFMKHH